MMTISGSGGERYAYVNPALCTEDKVAALHTRYSWYRYQKIRMGYRCHDRKDGAIFHNFWQGF